MRERIPGFKISHTFSLGNPLKHTHTGYTEIILETGILSLNKGQFRFYWLCSPTLQEHLLLPSHPSVDLGSVP